jgi:4-hydroxy-tetrahydrodipicolinate synthase
LRPLLGPEFRLLSGDDATALAFLLQGGDGCISVTSNVAPRLCRAMYWALREGQLAHAQRLATAAATLTAALSCESNPAPVKYALGLLNLMSPRVRLPLVELRPESKARIDAVMAEMRAEHGGYIIADIASRGRGVVQSVANARPRRALAVAS